MKIFQHVFTKSMRAITFQPEIQQHWPERTISGAEKLAKQLKLGGREGGGWEGGRGVQFGCIPFI